MTISNPNDVLTPKQRRTLRSSELKLKRNERIIQAIQGAISSNSGISSQWALLDLVESVTGSNRRFIAEVITAYTGRLWDYEIIDKQGLPYRYFLLAQAKTSEEVLATGCYKKLK